MTFKTRYAAPAAALATLVLGTGVAYAATPGTFSMAPFTGFTSAQQAAIEKAFEIRRQANEDAQATLDAAGVSREAMHTAMQTYRDTRHAAVEAAIEANDYQAFTEAIANTPRQGQVSAEIFAKMVQMHKLEQAGDRAAAQSIRQELRASGVAPMGGMGMMGFRHGG